MKPNGTVIAYHAIGFCPESSDPDNLFIPPERFERQMAFLARRHTVVPLERIVRGAAPRNAVAITFDDGFSNVLKNAVPVMRRFGFASTVFVPSKWLGQTSSAWYQAAGCETGLMSAVELREGERLGLAAESHGSAHLDLSLASPEDTDADLDSSIEQLSEALGRRPRFLAYPWGRYSTHATEAAAARFDAAFSIDRPYDGPFAHERVGITGRDGMLVFAMKASGRYIGWRRSRLGSAGYSLVRPLLRRARG